MSRAKHMQWCKDRAIEYVDNNDLQQAFSSMVSDLSKHEETSNHAAIQTGMMIMLSGGLNTQDSMRKFILGFN